MLHVLGALLPHEATCGNDKVHDGLAWDDGLWDDGRGVMFQFPPSLKSNCES